MVTAVSSENIVAVEMLLLQGAVGTTDAVILYRHRLTDTNLLYQLLLSTSANNNDLVQRIMDTGISVNDVVSGGVT